MIEDSDNDGNDQFKKSPAQQLLKDINLELKKTHNETIFPLVVAFKTRFLALRAVDTPPALACKQAIYDALMRLARKDFPNGLFEENELSKFKINTNLSPYLSAFQALAGTKKTGLDASGDLSDSSDPSAAFEPRKMSKLSILPTSPDDIFPLSPPNGGKVIPPPDHIFPPPPNGGGKVSPRAQLFSVSPVPPYLKQNSVTSKSDKSVCKPVDLVAIALFKQKLNMYLIQFNDDLKVKLENSKDQVKALEIYKAICRNLNPLIKDPSEANLKRFKIWFDTMLSKQKGFFKATPWVWWDVIRPLFLGFLGVVVTLITAPVRPFIPSVAVFADSFFVKPISPAFKVIMNESETLFKGIESAAVLAM